MRRSGAWDLSTPLEGQAVGADGGNFLREGAAVGAGQQAGQFGIEVSAVVELDTAAQLERIGEAVGAHLIALCEHWNNL